MLAFLTDSEKQRCLLSPALLSGGIFHYIEGLANGSKLCDEKEIGGVILDAVEDPDAASGLCAELRARYPEMPIALLLDAETIPNATADRIIRSKDECLLREVMEFCHAVMGRERQILSTRQLYITEAPDDTRYLGYPLLLSEAEHRLLLCLTYLAPRVASPDELHRLCDPQRLHSAKSLAVRIASFNRKAKEIHPRVLIRNVFKRGYFLNTDVL